MRDKLQQEGMPLGIPQLVSDLSTLIMLVIVSLERTYWFDAFITQEYFFPKN